VDENQWAIPFPQANDFEKIITLLNVDDAEKLGDKKYLSTQMDMVTDRQVLYYVSACAYLGLISKDKKFTKIANELRLLNSSEQMIELARLIVSDEVFGNVYFAQKIYGMKLSNDEIIEVMKNHNVLFDSEEMYKRRAQTVSSWLSWIENNFG
jgi:hypothetical protein